MSEHKINLLCSSVHVCDTCRYRLRSVDVLGTPYASENMPCYLCQTQRDFECFWASSGATL